MATIEPEPPFSKSKAMELPRSVVIGHDAILQVGEIGAKLKLGRRALIVAESLDAYVARLREEAAAKRESVPA